MTATRPPLYADENVDGCLLRALERLGWDVARAAVRFPAGTADEVHFAAAAEASRLLFSHDADMLARGQVAG